MRTAGGRGDVVRQPAGRAAAGGRRGRDAGARPARGRPLSRAGAEHARHAARRGGRRRGGRGVHGGVRGVHVGEPEHDDRRLAGCGRGGARPGGRARLVAPRVRVDGVRLSLPGAGRRGGRGAGGRCADRPGMRGGLDRRHDRHCHSRRRRPGGRALLERRPRRAPRAAPPRHRRPGAGERRGRASSWASQSSTAPPAAQAAAPSPPALPATSQPSSWSRCSTATASPTASTSSASPPPAPGCAHCSGSDPLWNRPAQRTDGRCRVTTRARSSACKRTSSS